MWERDEDRLALLELLESGRLRRRTGQGEAWTLLDQLPWTRRTGRRDEFELVVEHKNTVVELLDRVWPHWRLGRDVLIERGLSPTPTDWRRLQDLLRADGLAELPDRLNRRTATSAVAPHSKSNLSLIRRAALGDTTVTRDGIVRLRPPPGVCFVRGSAELDEYVEKRALPGEWADDLNLDDTPALIRALADRGLWLEQEIITLDPRLRAALEAVVES